MPHVPGHTTNQPFSGVLPSDKPSARKSNASFINQLTNLFKTNLQSQLKANKNLFDAYRTADQELDALSLTNFIPGGQSTFGLPYPDPDREPIIRSVLERILQDTSNISPFSSIEDLTQKIMEGLTMQSGAPGTIGRTPGQPSMPFSTPMIDGRTTPVKTRSASGVPGTAAYQKDQRLQDPRLDAFMMAGMRPGDTFSNSPLPPQLMNPNLGSVPFGQNTAMSPQEFANFVSKTQGLKDQSRQTYTPGM